MNQPQQLMVSGVELWQWFKQARLAAVVADIPISEVDWLLQEVAGLDKLALRLESFKDQLEIPLSMPFSKLATLWQQRVDARMPVQYLTGVAPWRNFLLSVSSAVLIPRPETECLIELAVAAVEKSPKLKLAGCWADLGTGSGAIALGLADSMPAAQIHAVDYSAAALEIASYNAQKLGFEDQIQFHQGSWWEPLNSLKGQFSGMVSNPPYIPSTLIPQLQPEVAWHEPHLALNGGSDGLDYIRHLIEVSPVYLRPGGIWLIEMMAGQAPVVAELLREQGNYCNIQIFSDLAGIERFALAYRA
ncbi:MAG TPA: peptide chain release factor N(5)-glutamine methyltransferase [Oculatellaceae cyanobacterium]|jgi:release factor glutamine methyltransferase